MVPISVKRAIEKASYYHPILRATYVRERRKQYLRRFYRDGPKKRGSGMTFLILNHCYDLGVEAYLLAGTSHTLWVMEPNSIFAEREVYFPPEHRELNIEYGRGAMALSIANYKKNFITPMVEELIERTHLDALITPSDIFYWLRPVVEELRGRGIPTLVQDKEGTLAPGPITDNFFLNLARNCPPIGDRFFFWNENQLRLWKLAGIDETKTEILGQPRSDIFFHPERVPSKESLGLSSKKKLIVAFTFDADAYAAGQSATKPVAAKPWRTLRDQMHEALRNVVSKRRDVEVAVKAHPQQVDLQDVVAEFKARPTESMRLYSGAATASHLTLNSDVVVGFQTTALIEAMLTTRPVIYVGWDKAHDILDSELVPIHHSGGVEKPQSQGDLEQMIERALEGQLTPTASMMESRKKFTGQYFARADGQVARRVLEASEKFVLDYRAR